jgi:hypothetical protein
MNRADNPNRRFYSSPKKSQPSYKAYTPQELDSIELYAVLTDVAKDYLFLHFHPEFEFEFWGWILALRNWQPEFVLVDEDHPLEEWIQHLIDLDEISKVSGTWWLFQGPHIAISLEDWEPLYEKYKLKTLTYFDLRNMYLKYGFNIQEVSKRWYGFEFSRWHRKDADSLD